MSLGSVARRPLYMAAASVAILLLPKVVHADFNVVGADIPELETALFDGQTTDVDVVQQYLDRIQDFNRPTQGGINAVFEVNPNILSEAASVDSLIAGGATTAQYPLLGVPVLVKGSYDVAGLITDNGVSVLAGVANTPGSTTLIPTTNAFSVQQLIDEGAIIMGKANMSTMAYSYDGIDNAGGVVLNPFQPLRTPGGSSSGIGAGISSDFAMLGMGGETGGSIRVPSNADGDVGLKTSAGLIDPGGTWPLTPSRDVVGPIAKDVTDIAYAMNALVAPGANNLWNGTPFYPDPSQPPGSVRPVDYTTYLKTNALQGKVIAVPNSMSGVGTQYEGTVVPVVMTAFNNALAVLQAEGATIVHVDIPASTTYYSTIGASKATVTGFPYPYPVTTSGGTATTTPSSTWSNLAAAYYYEKQIESYNDPIIKNLTDFSNALAAGKAAGAGSKFSTLSSAASSIASLAAIYQAGTAAGFGYTNGVANNPDAIEALQGLTDLRNVGINQFMANPGIAGISHIDAFVAPTYGGVMPYVAKALQPAGGLPTDPFAVSGSASLLGRFEGNILGLPSISVPMGYTSDGTPMGIQFFDQLDGEGEIIGDAYAYEQASEWRTSPNLSFVPEPASATVMVLGGLLLGTRRRRKPRATSSV